jgi:hypothetical protein
MTEGEASATESTEVDLSADFRESGVAEVLDQLDRVMRHLLGQLAGRAHDQGTRSGRFEVAGIGRVLAFFALGRRLTIGQCLCTSGIEIGALLGFGSGLLLNQSVQNRQQKGGSFA